MTLNLWFRIYMKKINSLGFITYINEVAIANTCKERTGFQSERKKIIENGKHTRTLKLRLKDQTHISFYCFVSIILPGSIV